jgi:3-hydroxyisobutyrate dehydrogenase-like beta-hydroxyacid dehydrogenase
MNLKVAQIGLGAIGSIYTRHLLKAGVELSIYDSDAARLAQFRESGATIASSCEDLLRNARFILVSLPDPDAARAALLGDSGALSHAKPGTIVLDVSTLDPRTARELYAFAKGRGVSYLEAPVSGGEPMSAGTDGAANANITFMVGGDEDAFEKAKPLMAHLGKFPLYLGEAGYGATIKLISNHQAGLINLLNAEAFAMGRAAGISEEVLFKVFEHTDASSYWLHNYFKPRLRSNNYRPGFSVDLQHKDHRLMDEVARTFKVPMPFNALALQIYQILRARGDGGKDLVEAANLFAEFANVDRFDKRPAQ